MGEWESKRGIGGGKKIQRIQCAEIRHRREIENFSPRRVEKLKEMFPVGVT